MSGMKRREFVTLLGGTVAAWPLAARAQQPPQLLRIGTVQSSVRNRPTWGAFEQQLRELGYIEGQNLRSSTSASRGEKSSDRYAQGIKDVLQRGVDVLVASSSPALSSAISVTDSVPIVMVALDFDPVALGYVTSMARPTGNVTGVFLNSNELAVKRLQLLKEAFPDRPGATVFWDQRSSLQWQAVESAAPSLGVRLAGVELRDPPYNYERALSEAPADLRGTLFALLTPFLFSDRSRVTEFALQRRIASFFGQREFADVGALMTYGPNSSGMWRRAAEYVGKIAQGAKTTDLPIEQPTKFELVINLKTAKALGLEISPTLLARADEVIE